LVLLVSQSPGAAGSIVGVAVTREVTPYLDQPEVIDQPAAREGAVLLEYLVVTHVDIPS
jgi:hypothetical protein